MRTAQSNVLFEGLRSRIYARRGLNLADLTGTIFIAIFMVGIGLICYVLEACEKLVLGFRKADPC